MKILRHISYANVVSTMALVFALAGGAVAATHMAPKNSVDSRSIKNNSVRTGDVRDRSLRAKDFKSGELPAGAKGDKGEKGDVGDPGSVRGWALVESGGAIVSGVTSGNVSVSHPATGKHCVGLTDGAANAAVVTIEYESSQTTVGANGAKMAHAEITRVGSLSNSCPSGQLEVRTFVAESDLGADSNKALDLTLADQPFFILFP